MTSSPSQTFETIPVQLGHYTYPIILGDGILSQLPELCNKYNVGKKVMIITNPVLMRLYALQIRQYFKQAGYECQFIEVPEGEASKCMSEVNRLLTFLLKYQMERQDTILALGGGVIGDLAGFVASIYLRGIHLIQVPTTLLSQVDSAIGGKTGVNHEMGKNLIGSFYHPKFTFIDTQTLSSLPKREIRCGLAEVIKYGLISTPELFTYIETNIDEIKRFEGRFKKQLQRKTTKPEFLQGYLNILTSWYESKGCNKKQLGAIKPKKISAFIAAEMRKLSEELDFYNE